MAKPSRWIQWCLRCALVAAALSAVQLWSQSPASTSSVPAQPGPDSDDPAKLHAEIDSYKAKLGDFAELSRYRIENAELPAAAANERRVVMFGDSITDDWRRSPKNFFPGKPYVNRGIKGQTTAQMLVRFRADVIDLKPAVVVILAGTNDIANRKGRAGVLEAVENNLTSMDQLARANGIKVVLATLLPVCGAQLAKRSPDDILQLNQWIAGYAKGHNIQLLDYYPAMLDSKTGQLRESISHDCLHPNVEGYDIMQPMVERAIASALGPSTAR
ncbi:GDSL-type esterase/lipase family protein [Edaphobacter flagellatus]|uniref:GDSL-type esterase/lipase family protein n=1 Tax=Edaphobacter flagellatus TaxID=1933044 RepID=UPI0021B298A7|nr:GDSL-type esterase/lipase family protein [Edaphobacter flagellatus]